MRVLVTALVLLVLGASTPAEAQSLGQAIQQATTGNSPSVRTRGLFVIKNSGDPRAISACVRVLEKAADPVVRRLATRVLARLLNASATPADRKRALEALARAAKADPDRRVRRSADRMHKRLTRKRSQQTTAAPTAATP